jgi:hypothetical protein
MDRAAAGGANFGWPIHEGPDPFTTCPHAVVSGFTAPIYWFPWSEGQSMISAGVYRLGAGGAAAFPAAYEGDLFLSDYYGGFLRRLKGGGASWSVAPPVPGQPNSTDWATGLHVVTDWAQAADGSLWYLRQAVNFVANTGEIRSIGFAGPAGATGRAGAGLSLEPPRPSPARGRVTLAFTLPARARVDLGVFDAAGRRVRTLESGAALEAGAHASTWDGRDAGGREATAGLYWVRLEAAGERVTRRLVKLR